MPDVIIPVVSFCYWNKRVYKPKLIFYKKYLKKNTAVKDKQ